MTSKWSTALSTLAFVLFGSSAARAEWVAKESPTDNALVQVQCLTTTSCWIAGVGGVVLHSSDGGEQWEEVDSGAPANYGAWNGLSFVDENTGWFSGLRIISRTPDSGETWKGATMGPGPFDDPPFQNALWAISSQLAWSVGADLYDVGGGSVLGVPSFWIHGVDGDGEFQNYTQRVIPTLTGIFYDIEFVGTQDAWAVGYSDQPVKTGIVYRVQNASAEDPLITPQAFAQDLSLEGISMIDTQQGWIVGEAGLILRTNNGGVAWSSQPSGVTDDLWDVHFVDSANGWAVGEAGIIMSTKNGGSSWQNTTWSATAHLTSVHFLSADFGFAVGSSGTILKWEEPTCDDTEECGGGPGGGAGSGGAQAPGVGGEGGRAGEGGASAEAGMGGDGSREPGGAGESSSAGDGAGPGPSTGGTANDGGVSAGANAAVDPSDRVSRQSEGCGCRTTSGSSPKSAAVLALLAGLALLRRRGSGRLV